MKTIDELKTILKRHKEKLNKEYKVKRIGIFGSYVRGEQKKASDLDVLVEFYEPIGWEFVDLKEFLEMILGEAVDLLTASSLKPQIKDNVLREVVYA